MTWFANRRQKQKLVDPNYVMKKFTLQKYGEILTSKKWTMSKSVEETVPTQSANTDHGIPINVTVPANSTAETTNITAPNTSSSPIFPSGDSEANILCSPKVKELEIVASSSGGSNSIQIKLRPKSKSSSGSLSSVQKPNTQPPKIVNRVGTNVPIQVLFPFSRG